MLTLPNILTLSRIALLPVLIWLIYAGYSWAAFALYAVCAATDFLDGYLARKLNAVSPFGTFLDPISDKVFIVLILLTLVDTGPLSGPWVIAVMVIITRELLISGLREFLGPKNVQMPVTKLAKWKTTVQMISMGFLIVAPALPAALMAGQLLTVLAAALTAYTGWLYLKAGFPHLK
ncbi:MAG: CDP-diacylglycerol--glycerol-3-phosphate 3-phosphatidyltransferase [Micavibrio sp.]|nr:CDP-diacylglycerol--glycerol-3-phosphate 3-phosphatidyltransferase [Micavibrio sp.]|tara:strand:- start:318 stop:848 length:531 start_codon:yes stop_codon:yes gene_type:complete